MIIKASSTLRVDTVHNIGEGTESNRGGVVVIKSHINKQSTHHVEIVHEIGDGTESYRGAVVA